MAQRRLEGTRTNSKTDGCTTCQEKRQHKVWSRFFLFSLRAFTFLSVGNFKFLIDPWTLDRPHEKVFSPKTGAPAKKSSVIVKPQSRKELKMATKMIRKGRSGAKLNVSPDKQGNNSPDKQTHLDLSPRALPTILSDTSPQEEVGDEVRRKSRRSGADFIRDQEEAQDEGKRKSRRAGGASGPQEEILLQEGEGLTVRTLYRYFVFNLGVFVCQVCLSLICLLDCWFVIW